MQQVIRAATDCIKQSVRPEAAVGEGEKRLRGSQRPLNVGERGPFLPRISGRRHAPGLAHALRRAHPDARIEREIGQHVERR